MNRIFKLLLTLMLTQSAAASEVPMLINHGIDGSWVNPNANSQGLVIETLPSANTLVAFWFTFNLAGGEREWFIALGDINGAGASLKIVRVEGGVFDQTSVTEEVQWGTARIVFSSCTSASFEFESTLESVSGSFPLLRLTPDVACLASQETAHTTFVTRSNQWLDAQGMWVFDVCVNLGPSESHGREEFRFEGATLSFDIDHYNAANCQGPKTVQQMDFGLSRRDKVKASLAGAEVIANRVLLQDSVSGAMVKQIFYFDTSVNPPVMTHGNFDGPLDADGYPATLHEIFSSPAP